MITWLLVIMGLACAAPLLHRVLRGATHWVLAAAAAALTAYLASLVPEVARGGVLLPRRAWAPQFGLEFSLLIDGWSVLMALIISGIGALILLYAGGYLAGHRQLGAMYAYLLLFMGAMLGVALSDNLILLFIFWELTSLSSYLLIGFEHERAEARAAALQALLVTGLGGLALLAGAVLLGMAGGSFEISVLLSRGAAVQAHGFYTPIVVLVLLGALTKSAQFPFHFWLPNAMEAPTPVSAYLHSATMVKAGVFLLARMTPILGGTVQWQSALIGVGALTMLLGAVMATGSRTLKRILAYSTISVLGTLTMLIGVGTTAALHAAAAMLLAHALYKGALFMTAGALSHATGENEAERLSGLGGSLRMTAAGGMLAALSMAGIPPLVGFVAKEIYYESALGGGAWWLVLTGAAVAANVLLAAVALRVGLRPFVGTASHAACAVHAAPASLWLGPVVLGVLGAAAGLAVGATDRALVAPAALAIGARERPAELAIWHGFNAALGLSALTLAGGLAVFATREWWVRLGGTLVGAARVGPDAAYQRAMAALNAIARGQTGLLQSGYLRVYLWLTVAATTLLVGYPLLFRGGWQVSAARGELEVSEVIVCLVTLAGAVSAVRSRQRLAAVASLGVVGFGVALIFVMYGAPDLAMTQVLIETLIVILFVLVFYHLPPFSAFSGRGTRVRDAVVATVFGTMMALLVLAAGITVEHDRVSDFFAERSLSEAHGRNVVNVILVDFRAADTLGEIVVLATAGVGVYALLKLRRGGRRAGRGPS